MFGDFYVGVFNDKKLNTGVYDLYTPVFAVPKLDVNLKCSSDILVQIHFFFVTPVID